MPSHGLGNIGTAMLFEPFLLEQKGRVQQTPSCERPFATTPLGGGKSILSEKTLPGALFNAEA
jgi:hypothetical protein